MNRRACVLVIGSLATATLGLALGGMTGCIGGCSYSWPPPTEPLTLGIDVDLHAVVEVEGWIGGERRQRYLAVGAEGTVVVWGDVFTGNNETTTFVEVSDAASVDLRAAWLDASSWWVVGDAGTIAVSDNDGGTWHTVELPQISANLQAITGVAGRPVVVGDDVVVVRIADGTWVEPPPPDGGWGQLRGVHSDGARVYAVGLGGVIWSSSEPSELWIAEDSPVTTDLLAIGRFGHNGLAAVGAEGTLLVHEQGGWAPADTGVTVDLVDYDDLRALGANGEVFTVDGAGALTLTDTYAGARALAFEEFEGLATVGAGGAAMTPGEHACE